MIFIFEIEKRHKMRNESPWVVKYNGHVHKNFKVQVHFITESFFATGLFFTNLNYFYANYHQMILV